jgi:hypothetical protein
MDMVVWYFHWSGIKGNESVSGVFEDDPATEGCASMVSMILFCLYMYECQPDTFHKGTKINSDTVGSDAKEHSRVTLCSRVASLCNGWNWYSNSGKKLGLINK